MPTLLKEYRKRETSWKEDAKQWFAKETPISLERGHEYAAYIINALQGGEPFTFNGNVRNTGLVTNLPTNACVEVPVWVSKKGLEPAYVGALPPAVRSAHQSQLADRRDGCAGVSDGQPAPGVPGHCLRPAHCGCAFAGTDQAEWSTRCSNAIRIICPRSNTLRSSTNLPRHSRAPGQ